MTQTTEPGPSSATASPPPGGPLARARERAPALVASLFGGAVAAGLGLGAAAVLVTGLWISSPFPDSGPGGALRLAAALWFLAHGTELTRQNELTGASAPLGLVPLLLTVLPLWLLHRAAREAAEPPQEPPLWPPASRPRGRGVAVAGVYAGYLATAGAALLYALGGDPAPVPLSALVHVPLLAALAVASGVSAAHGWPDPLARYARGAGARAWARPEVLRAVYRAAGAGVLVLLGSGALLVALALVSDGAATRASFEGLTDVWSGLFGVLLLAVCLVPNAAVWGAAYCLGPGFLLGAGHVVAPGAADPLPGMPPFPLLVGVPEAGGGTPLSWAVFGFPVLAGLAVARVSGRAATAGARTVWTVGATAYAAAGGALLCGLGLALLSALAGGPLGTGALAEFGPVGWRVGAAAFGWTALLGVPGALGVRAWGLRGKEAFLVRPGHGSPGAASEARAETQARVREALEGRWWLPRRDRNPAAADVPGRGPGSAGGKGTEGEVPQPGTPAHGRGTDAGPGTATGAAAGGRPDGKGAPEADTAYPVFDPYEFTAPGAVLPPAAPVPSAPAGDTGTGDAGTGDTGTGSAAPGSAAPGSAGAGGAAADQARRGEARTGAPGTGGGTEGGEEEAGERAAGKGPADEGTPAKGPADEGTSANGPADQGTPANGPVQDTGETPPHGTPDGT
ncbi:DUF6350 family protein [Streptomyces sp. NPDC007088]|uniref:cell division protein PerM n=1 Tax=Streptomyces sp. NPDC007088 TaxID=3364773 RepID=UPI0036A184E6